MIPVVLVFGGNKPQQHEVMPAVPRIGEIMTVESQHYRVVSVRWHLYQAMKEGRRETSVIILLVSDPGESNVSK
jgi:hypothetical protein